MESELKSAAIPSPFLTRHRLRWLGCIFIIVLFGLGFSPESRGQGQYSFRNWQSEDGLPVNLVRSIVQAADGHLWIATAECIARFDGVEFERIDQIPGFPYPHSGDNRLFATAGGSVWFSSSQGGLLRIKGNKPSVIWPDTGGEPVSQVVDFPGGGILVKAGNQICLFQDQQIKRLDSPSPEVVACLEADLAERAKKGRIGPDGLPGNLVDRSGSVWSVSRAGELTVTSPEGFRRVISMLRISPDSHVTELLEDREGNIWIATALNGLGLFREDRVEVVNAAAGLSEGAVLAVIEDTGKQVWLGNRRGGVDRIITGIIEHHDLGTAAGVGQVSALYEDRDGRLWAASTEGPVFRWKDSQFIEHFAAEAGPTKVNAIYHDGRGTLWFGGQLGLMRSTGRRVTEVKAEAGFPGGEVTVMSGGAANELWLGTSQGFVLKDTDGRLETIATPGDLHYSRVSGILVTSATQVWVTTMGAGLFLHDGEKWHHFDRARGLPDLRLTQVVDDRLGHLWFGSTGGILRASREDLLARAKDADKPIHWLRMDRSDGLPTRECVGGHHPAGWRFNDGSIWFPTSLGVVRIDPSRTMVNRTPPPVYLRGVTANGVPQALSDKKLNFGPGRARIEFRYHGINFSSPEKVNYRTRLVGLEESWRDVGTQRLATYESVPPGNYRFEVVAINGDGLLSPAPASVRIAISPHFWETAWFVAQAIILMVLVAGAVGWLIARSRLKRRISLLKVRNTRELERARIARDLHDELGASLTEIALLADLGAEQAEGSAYQKQLDELSNKARMLGLTLDEIVWAVNPREDTLASLLDYLASFATEFLDRAGITLRMNIATGMPDLPLDATVRHSVFLAVREAFNNIVKHSEARSAWLHVSLSNNILDITVEDDGKGVDDYALSRGHGLTNFKVRMQACGGESSVTCRAEGGTRVRFLVPVLAPESQPT
ncbi:MAG: two-component regulator propeller domain-containing protein [Verrucomicrobiota bacterium]